MSRVPPTYSSTRAVHHEPHEHDGVVHNRRARRDRRRHNPLFTSGNVWRDTTRLNEHGLTVRFTRLAKRRKKSQSWVEKRVQKFLADQREAVRKYNIWLQEMLAKAKEEASGTDIRITTNEPGSDRETDGGGLEERG